MKLFEIKFHNPRSCLYGEYVQVLLQLDLVAWGSNCPVDQTVIREEVHRGGHVVRKVVYNCYAEESECYKLIKQCQTTP